MESVFRSAPGGKVHEVYDLKGSWIDRHSNVQEAGGGTYKDMDLHKPLRLDRAVADAVLDELRRVTATPLLEQRGRTALRTPTPGVSPL